MQIIAKSIDDFKTDRKEISPPLPVVMRLLPVLFYLTIVATIVLNSVFFLTYSHAGRSREEAIQRDRKIQADLKTSKQQRADLENEAKKASDIVAWLEASRPLQPLIVEIARSIGPDASIVELRLDRDAENPAQIRFSMRLSSDSTRQLDITLAKISNLRFRAFSPQQKVEKGEIDYKATLIWLDANREEGTQESRYMNTKQIACVIVFLLILCMGQGTLWMNNRMKKMQADANKADAKAKNSATQLALENRQLEELRQNSKGLIEYLNVWQPYFAAVDSPQNAELKISLRIKEDNLVSLSQRYQVASQKNRSLPSIMRAQLTFEDEYSRLMNWIGRMESDLPTMRINSLRIGRGTGDTDLKVDMTLEQPIVKAQP